MRRGTSCGASAEAESRFGEDSSLTKTVRPSAVLAVVILSPAKDAVVRKAQVIRARTRCRFISFPWAHRASVPGRPSPNPKPDGELPEYPHYRTIIHSQATGGFRLYPRSE